MISVKLDDTNQFKLIVEKVRQLTNLVSDSVLFPQLCLYNTMRKSGLE
jgi:hypothetical protein